MAYVNVKEWSVDQVTEWLKGLDGTIVPYTTAFLNNGVTGYQLLNLRSDDLDNLGVRSLGHQEIILEAVEHLRHFHYELDKENLQMLSLKVSCASNSLYRELLLLDDNCEDLPTQMMSDVHNIINTIKPLVCWLDWTPFSGDKDYIDIKTQLLQLSFEMATSAHRGKFAQCPINTIRGICEKITKLADFMVQECHDPMVLQPASLNLATLKKKEQELGFYLLPSNHAVHQIVDIKYGSPAHGSKIEEGDEIVQINYLTVVGWERKQVMIQLQDSPPEIVLTLKKRPKHTTVYGQIYMKPYRLPSKKRDSNLYSRWNDGLPSPRLMPIHNLPPINIPTNRLPVLSEPPEAELSSSDDSEPPDSPFDGRVYPLKPRPILQRRNTVTGASPTSKRPYPSMEQCVQLWKNQAAISSSSYTINKNNQSDDLTFLRDKSASCSLGGLELGPRPTTVLGITSTKKHHHHHQKNNNNNNGSKKKVIFETMDTAGEKSVSVNSLASLTHNDNLTFIDEGRDLTDRTSMMDGGDAPATSVTDTSSNESTNVKDIIKKFNHDDKRSEFKPKVQPRTRTVVGHLAVTPEVKKPIVPPRTTFSAQKVVRGRLDKSHSTPAYDLTPEVTTDVTPVISDENKYEQLGIPIVVEAINSAVLPPVVAFNCEENIKPPPRPPPRTFGVVDLNLNKPAYPSDSPKPVIGVAAPLSVGKTKGAVFEFPPPPPSVTTVPGAGFEGKIATTARRDVETSTDVKLMSPVIGEKNDTLTKISPTNSIVRAMVYSPSIASKNSKVTKKRNNVIAKRRKVSVADLQPCDIQGYLYQRLRSSSKNAQSQTQQNVHWEKRWFVLLGSCLYGYKAKGDQRAACLIFLSGFTVAVASEVKSRANAFKVYHTGTVFYFSAEENDQLTTWIEMVSAATSDHCLKNTGAAEPSAPLYSETDDSDGGDVKTTSKAVGNTSKGDSSKFGSLKKFTSGGSRKNSGGDVGSTSLDRKWFFNKSSSSIAASPSLPVPTSQFRSYRKVVRSSDVSSVTTGNFTSHVAQFAPRSEIPKLPKLTSTPNLESVTVDSGAVVRPPINYVHASNPSLSDALKSGGHFNKNDRLLSSSSASFGTAAAPPSKKGENLGGFITLEDLMRKECEERRAHPFSVEDDENFSINLDLIQPDVVYGEVPIRSRDDKPPVQPTLQKDPEDSVSSCFGKRIGHSMKKTTHSLPRTSYNSKQSPHYASDRNLNSYKMISCPETTTNNEIQWAQNRNLDSTTTTNPVSKKKTSKVKKQRSFSSGSSDTKVKKQLKSAGQYTPIPIDNNMTNHFELNLDGEKKSPHSNKFRHIFKSNKTADGRDYGKEKTFLGSPKLHRAIFSSHSRKNSSTSCNADVFSNWPECNETSGTSVSSAASYPQDMSSSCVRGGSDSPLNLMTMMSPHADYPDMHYPPTFEPETYSLADPQSSLTLLRKQGNKDAQ